MDTSELRRVEKDAASAAVRTLALAAAEMADATDAAIAAGAAVDARMSHESANAGSDGVMAEQLTGAGVAVDVGRAERVAAADAAADGDGEAAMAVGALEDVSALAEEGAGGAVGDVERADDSVGGSGGKVGDAPPEPLDAADVDAVSVPRGDALAAVETDADGNTIEGIAVAVPLASADASPAPLRDPRGDAVSVDDRAGVLDADALGETLPLSDACELDDRLCEGDADAVEADAVGERVRTDVGVSDCGALAEAVTSPLALAH